MSSKKPLQIVAQLVDKKTGARSRPVTKTRQEFADALAELLPPDSHEKSYVLVLADDSVEPGNLDFALAPLMTVGSFITAFASDANVPRLNFEG